MWPKLLDLPREQCGGLLRNLECSAYTSLVDAYRAGGVLTEEKKSSLETVAAILNISVDRHKAEVRRAVNDELLTTISERLCGLDQTYSWAKEGRRIIPLLPRALPLTALTSVAGEAAQLLSQNNSKLNRPSQTRTAAVPVLSKPDHLLSPESLTNGSGEGTTGTEGSEEEGEGVVVLPSGTMVRVSGKPTSRGGRGGKRRRSSSKCYEVLPGGGEREDCQNSPPRKISSVLGAGHGYARPLPSLDPSLGGSVRLRGPGRPPGPQLTVGAAGVYHQVTGRGRPRMVGSQVRGRSGQVSRGRGGVLITPRMPSPVVVPPPSVSSARLALRPSSVASPRATTIQLKQETPGLQGLKVISHSNTKIVPKSATAVYVVPSSQQRILAGQRLVSPALPGVIKTVRPGKPSVIVVQKGSGLPAVSGGVALYRPARALVCNPRVSSGPATSSNNLILVNISQSDTATTNVGPTHTTSTTVTEHKDSLQNGEAQESTDNDGTTEPNGSDQDSSDMLSEKNNGEVEESEKSETIFSSKKVTLPPRTPAVDLAGETETEETIPTYDLSTGENITNVLESEILENNIIESNGNPTQE